MVLTGIGKPFVASILFYNVEMRCDMSLVCITWSKYWLHKYCTASRSVICQHCVYERYLTRSSTEFYRSTWNLFHGIHGWSFVKGIVITSYLYKFYSETQANNTNFSYKFLISTHTSLLAIKLGASFSCLIKYNRLHLLSLKNNLYLWNTLTSWLTSHNTAWLWSSKCKH